MEQLAAALPAWLWRAGIVILALTAAILLHWVVMALVHRLLNESSSDQIMSRRFRQPARWLLIAVTLSAIQPVLDLTEAGLKAWDFIAGLIVPALIGWLVVSLLGAATDVIKANLDITVSDNLQARRRRTRIDILNRIAVFLVLLATFCFMLMSIPSVRNIGVTLIASAGLAALAVGAAAQPALKNLIAGIQMAFTEPIRIDDVVIIGGEWGRIEEIRLTYVVVRIWDDRRLIVPVSKFLEESFQNWTRTTSAIVGSVFWYLDPATDIDRLRCKLLELVEANEKWDGRLCNLRVTETKPEAIEVRALMTAKDASTAFDLRCEVREALLKFIRTEMPAAIVRHRGTFELREQQRAAA